MGDYDHFVHDGALRVAGFYETELGGLDEQAQAVATKMGEYKFVRKIVEATPRGLRVESHFEKIS